MTLARQLGAVAAGCAHAEAVEPDAAEAYRTWIAAGCHGTMDYLARYSDVRFDPRLLLPGAQTVISMAFPYRPAGGYHHPHIADYALGQDYHRFLKQRLGTLAEFISDEWGASSRAAVDTAPILERYWAVKAGVGAVGRNRQLIVPGIGSGVFLAELVTTLYLEPDVPLDASPCSGCGRCVSECPGNALADGFDARRCRSYLSIEYRGDLDASLLGDAIYGCDICQRVCPANASLPPEALAEFRPDERLLALDRDALGSLTAGDWKRLTRGSAMQRIPYRQLLRNLNLPKA